MICYASRTGTRRNLALLADAGWRLLITPLSAGGPGRFRYALDNGAWSAFQAGSPFDDAAFLRAVERYGAGADWIVAPDIVAGGLASLELSLSWLPRLAGAGRLVLIAVQDGMGPADLAGVIAPNVGIFVGGTTSWKERSLPAWGALSRATGSWLHVGRVNSARRIALCAAAGAHSVDGTSASRYAKTLPRLDAARRQTALIL